MARARAISPLLVAVAVAIGTRSSSAASHQAFVASDIVSVTPSLEANDPAKVPMDVVVLSEGYTASEQATFLAKASALTQSLRTDQTAAPMRDATTFNFYYVWVPSNQSGAPWRNGQAAGDTAFGACVDPDGTLDADESAIDLATRAVVTGTNKTVAVLLIHLESRTADPATSAPATTPGANTSPTDVLDDSTVPEYLYKTLHKAATGHETGRVFQVDDDMRAFIHEMGHAGYGLDDEYSIDPTLAVTVAGKNVVAQFPNNTTDPTGARWRTLVPSLYDASGAMKEIVLGGSGFGTGVWHAASVCRMNQTRTELFCPVCQAIIRHSADKLGPLAVPAITSVVTDPARTSTVVTWKRGSAEQPECFHLQLRDANGRVDWTGDVEGQLDTASVPLSTAGPYTVSIEAERIDQANPGDGSSLVTAPVP